MATISSTHVQTAFDVIRSNGIAPKRLSTKWDVIDPKTGERFPPKAVLKRHSKRPTTRRGRSVMVVERSPAVSAYVKRLARGKCDLCRARAPFETKQGPFLECHHIHRLADGGPDSIENTVALCPNCHRRMHFFADPADVLALRQRVASRRRYLRPPPSPVDA